MFKTYFKAITIPVVIGLYYFLLLSGDYLLSFG